MFALQHDNVGVVTPVNNVFRSAKVTAVDDYHYYFYHDACPDGNILLWRQDTTERLVVGDLIDLTVENIHVDNFGFTKVFVRITM